MARNTTKPAPVVTREELSASVPEVALGAVVEKLVASFSAQLLSNDERTFDQAQQAYLGHAAGHKDDAIAEATTAAMHAAFPDRDPEVSVTKGGASVTRVTIVQRRQAWADLLEAGITPTVPTVRAAFNLSSSGAKGLSDMRKKLIADTKALAEDQRDVYFIEEARRRFLNLRNANKTAKSESAAGQSADNKAEDTSEVITLDTAEQFIALVQAELARPWSDDDKALIVAALKTELKKLA